MIRFQFPELFLAAIPLWLAFRRWGTVSGPTGWIRLSLCAILLIALAGPIILTGGLGMDVVIVADTSRSMPTNANLKELIQRLETSRGPHHAVGVVAFGSNARIEHPLSNTETLQNFSQIVAPDGSDLNAALHLALNMLRPNRPARVVVLSDGEANGGSPLSAARRAREMSVPIDYRLFERVRAGDVAVESVLLPESVGPKEPFQFTTWIYSERSERATIRVRREGREIAKLERDLTIGANRVLLRDILDRGGFYTYEVSIEVEGDPIPENNVGLGVVRVNAGSRLLVLTTDGDADSNFARRLRAGGIDLDVRIAGNHPLTLESLDQYRAVVLENVPARDLGRQKMERLAQFVQDLGGGLLLTGGERSFGTGGYFQSPLDEILPVSMEIRKEHRKSNVAIAIALDRSGSMSAPVTGGKVKMDLANLGTAACIRMLSPGDSVAVIAVDSAPHVIVPLTDVDRPEALVGQVLRIQSMGGGIFIDEALVAAGTQLKSAQQSTKHIILFSDANDSEQPGNYKSILAGFDRAGITCSVIGLGKNTDVDAKLLEEIAALGNGRILFSEDAQELPRLFTEDTVNVARSSFIKADEKTGTLTGVFAPEGRLVGNLGSGEFPAVGGYNLSYLKPEATPGVLSTDEYTAPWAAYWYRGLGRVAAITLEVDGQNTGAFADWEGHSDFLLTNVRWLLGTPSSQQVYLQVERDGLEARATLELDTAAAQQLLQPPRLAVIPPSEDRSASWEPDLVWIGPSTLQARFPVTQTGTYWTLVKTDDRQFVRGPALTLPYSPEFAPRQGLPTGAKVLEEVAEVSGGVIRANLAEAFLNPPRATKVLSLLPYLLILATVLLIVEIAGRRLSLWERVRDLLPETPTTVTGRALDADVVTPPTAVAKPRWSGWRKAKKGAGTIVAAANPSPSATSPTSAPTPASRKPETPAAAGPTPTSADVFEQAKRRAKR